MGEAGATDIHNGAGHIQLDDGLLRLFIEHAPAALAMFDKEMRYLLVSRRWRSDFGLGERQLNGISHYEVFPEISEQWRDVHRRGLAGESVSSGADRFERADGSVRWLRWEVNPWLDEHGEVGGIVIFSEDISGLLQTEQSRLATMGEMVGDMAHRWRQPLNNLGLLLQTLPFEFEHGSLSSASLKGTVAECMRLIMDMSKTIDELRHNFKPDSGRAPVS